MKCRGNGCGMKGDEYMRMGSLGSRLVALLLVTVMVVSMLPVGALAATVNDIAIGSTAGDTGVVDSTWGSTGTINWPIKIYDYLNDGMLFECATSTATGFSDRVVENQVITQNGAVITGGGAEYGGGKGMPITAVGTDFTADEAYSKSASLASVSTYYTKTRTTAVRFASPQYLHVKYQTSNDNRNLPLTYFSDDAVSAGHAKASVRYVALVYRSKGVTASATGTPENTTRVQFNLYSSNTAGSDNYYRATLKQGESDTWINSPDTWTYLVVDLKTSMPETTWNELINIKSVYRRCPLDSSSAYFDISHVAYFATEAEADNYGRTAAAFSNDPGEHLNDSATITLSAGTPIYYTYPEASEPGYTFSLASDFAYGTNAAPSSGESTRRLGLNFALGTGQSTTTYDRWGSGPAVTLYSGTTGTSFSPTKMTVSNVDNGSRDYVRLSSTTSSSNIILSEFSEGNDLGTYRLRARYLVLIYRANGYSGGERFGVWLTGYTSGGYSSTGFSAGYPSGGAYGTISLASCNGTQVEDGWVSAVIDLATISTNTYYKYIGLNLPTGSGKSLDLAYVAYFPDTTHANNFATSAVAYMNQGITIQTGTSAGTTKTLTGSRNWIAGNNLAFGLLNPSTGGQWYSHSGNLGGDPGTDNTYYTYRIGETLNYLSTADSYNQYRKVNGQTVSNQIYYVDSAYASSSTYQAAHTDYANGFDTSTLGLDGYTLLSYVTAGRFTAGLLEGSLGSDDTPVYRQETVEYVADLLYKTLVIPETDGSGNYNYNFIKGSTSTQFGGVDLNGDGDLGMVDLDGDGHAETNEESTDLATGLRHCLGIVFTFGQGTGAFVQRSDPYGLGSYADTLTRASKLKGSFASCRGSIYTCMDAAYYLLNNVFNGGSYNQVQNDHNYLTLSGAELTDSSGNGTGEYAFVFDAGFVYGGDFSALQNGTITQEQYKQDSKQAVVYGEDGTISIPNVSAKDIYHWGASDAAVTTRFPFMPVSDAEGDYAGQTESYYFVDDGMRTYTEEYGTYQGRNYNYVMVSNGEFVYYADEGLFFEFEGDDDVYLFINGELVLDIGGAHAITSVRFDINDYVEWAGGVIEAYEGDNTQGYTEADYARAKKLALTEGQVCSFDFYYMERHGYGANCRIVTNLHVTDPSLSVDKTAYQFGDEIPYGSVVDTASPIEYNFKLTNTGNTKLYDLTFADATIGVTLDPYADTALTVAAGNGVNVLDASGGALEAKDITAFVTGYKAVTGGKYVYDDDIDGYTLAQEGQTGTHDYTESTVTFADDTALRNFLKTLSAAGLESGTTDDGIIQGGSGLWVDASVTIKGIYYKMTEAQKTTGVLTNTVEVTATTKTSLTETGNETLRSSDSHRVYEVSAPYYYQWAGHELFISGEKLLTDLATEANRSEDSPLAQYKTFLDAVDTDTSQVYFRLSDKNSKAISYDGITSFTNGANKWGYLIDHEVAGTYSFYLTVFYKSEAGKYISQMAENSFVFARITVYVADVEDSTYVLDYGLKTETLDDGGDLFGDAGGLGRTVMGVSNSGTAPTYLSAEELKAASSTSTDFNRISFTTSTVTDGTIAPYVAADEVADGRFELSYEGGKLSDLTFQPTGFMDNDHSLWVAVTAHDTSFTPTALSQNTIDINNEVQMFKKVTVVPASVIYYEDDFSGITYTDVSDSGFQHHGNGSGALIQSVDQDTPYGQDATYQSSDNSLYSGDSLTQFRIDDHEVLAQFTFTGTDFELIGRTDASKSGIIVVEVFDETGESIQYFPVINEFDNGADGGEEGIYQVPVVRIKDLEYGQYRVEISGNPTYDFDQWEAEGGDIENYLMETYLYIDGVRVYQPIEGSTHEAYTDTEYGASFIELRDEIVNGTVAVGDVTSGSLTLSSGTMTWTENLLGDDLQSYPEVYVGNQVDSVDDYLIQGPNNEVYMEGTVTNSALVFYVQETSAPVHELQLAIRALDYQMFFGTGYSALNAPIQYGVKLDDGSYAWKPLVTVQSGTEQYYSIPYTECPLVDGNYQVVIRIEGAEDVLAMASYSSLKLVGLDLMKVDGVGEDTILYYENGILVNWLLWGEINGEILGVEDNSYYRFKNGKLDVTFTEDSYVALKTSTNVTYMVSGDDVTNETSATMVKTSTGGRLRVPAGEVTFTLTQDSTGAMVLSYCAHTYDETGTCAGCGMVNSDAATASGTMEAFGSGTSETALNLSTIEKQMSATYVVGAAVSEEMEELPEVEAVVQPTLSLDYGTVSFESEIQYNIYFKASDLDDVVEMGMITFDSELTDGTIDDAVKVYPNYSTDGSVYMIATEGIAAKNMADQMWFKIYAKLSDGSYVYTTVNYYSAVRYATSILNRTSSSSYSKALVVAMLNYGAEAQLYFGHNTDNLANAGLTEEQKALDLAYDETMVDTVVAPATSKTANFVYTASAFTNLYPSVSFDGAFSINFYFVASQAPDDGMTFYYWDIETYDSVDVLTKDNATGTMDMTLAGTNSYYGVVEGIAAKEMDETVFVAGVYEVDGVEYTTGIIAYSLGRYCETIAAKDTSDQQAFAQATAVYGYYAKEYFANL